MADSTRPPSPRVSQPPVPPGLRPNVELIQDGTWIGVADVPLALWSELIRYARRYRGLSQHALAHKAGVSQQTISKIENEEICPHDHLKIHLARALIVPIDQLFPWPGGGGTIVTWSVVHV